MLTKRHEFLQSDPVALAMAIVMDRVRHLPRQDREDLFELSKVVFSADSDDDEELNSAANAMLEILEQGSARVRSLAPSSPSGELGNRIAYVSNQIKTERKLAGLTQTELAKASGVPQSHISRLEHGAHSPSSVTLEKIATALGITVAQLEPST